VSTTHKLQGIAVVLFILVMATAFVLPNAGNERGDKAWSDRLAGQAAHEQAQAQVQRANKAWSDRLAAQAEAAAKEMAPERTFAARRPVHEHRPLRLLAIQS